MVDTLKKAANVAVKPAAGQTAQPGQARLILQDPAAFDQATMPALRGSSELSAEPVAVMEREKAREAWESLSLEPEVAQERQSERKRLLARTESLLRDNAAAKAQAIELKAELARAQDNRLNHPLVYAGAAGLLGLGALWWLERRKRMRLEDNQLESFAQPSPAELQKGIAVSDEQSSYLQEPGSVFSLEDSPDLATDFATDLSGLSQTKPATPTDHPVQARVKTTPDWAQPKDHAPQASVIQEKTEAASAWKDQDKSLLSLSKKVLSNILQRRSQRDALHSLHSSHTATEISSTVSPHSVHSPATLAHAEDLYDAMEWQHDEEAQEAFEQELQAQQLQSSLNAGYNPDQTNIELLSQTRASPQRGEDVMEHLLELRTAVSGLCALGRPAGAIKLLEEHIAADPSTCAWAYLEYMHVSELMDARDDFESMRKRYRQQFNRMAPYWHEPNANVLGLDGYSRAAGELCVAWGQGHAHAYNTLASWLIGPMLGRKIVQLPAYHDLFDLYEMLECIDLNPMPTSGQQVAYVQGTAAVQLANQAVTDQEFVPTVSLLDLDYEFSSDVTLEERDVEQAERSVTVVKPGNFSVDFNVAGTQMGVLSSLPGELVKK